MWAAFTYVAEPGIGPGLGDYALILQLLEGLDYVFIPTYREPACSLYGVIPTRVGRLPTALPHKGFTVIASYLGKLLYQEPILSLLCGLTLPRYKYKYSTKDACVNYCQTGPHMLICLLHGKVE